MKLYIKNMVCNRCKMVVKSELEKLGLQLLSIELGEVETLLPLSVTQKMEVAEKLKLIGFELIEDKKSITIEKIKILIVELIYQENNELNINLSVYISQNLNADYASLSHLFSETEGITIEKYFILQKIERAKELLTYDEMSLSEIAFLLNYSSVGYLSNQFKKITGVTPSDFKKEINKNRKQIDGL